MDQSNQAIKTESETTHRTAREAVASDGDENLKTSVVLPVYNEEENLQPLVEELDNTIESSEMAPFTPAELIFVDDGSSDQSRAVLRGLAEEYDSIKAVFLLRNFGQSAALSAGIDHATGEYVVTMDSDGQNNPADIPSLLETIESGYDCVSGWRQDRDDPLSKRIPSMIQTHLARMTGPDLHDFGCTLKAYRGSALRDIDIYGEGHRYIPAKLHKYGYSMTELEVDHRARTAGQTKYGWKRLFKGFIDLVFNIFWNRYSTRPLHFLGAIGFVMMAVGGTVGIHAVILRYGFRVSLLTKLPRLIFAVSLLIFGLQVVIFGFIAEILIKSYYRDDQPYRVGVLYD